MTAQLNITSLERPLSARFGLLATDIRTISDAASFITKLPKQYEGQLHWSLAGSTLEAADRHPENTDLLWTATLAMENALATERMLVD